MFTLEELAQSVGGTVHGDASIEIRSASPFEEAQPGDITLAAEPGFRRRVHQTRASAVIVDSPVESGGVPLLIVKKPKVAFAKVAQRLTSQPYHSSGVSPLAFVGEEAQIAGGVSIGPFACVGCRVRIEEEVTLHSGVVVGDECTIGRGSTLHANVTLYSGVKLGERVTVHSGSVLGADGFGYVWDGEQQVKLPQTGRVCIGDDVEIGANSCVDRATFGATVIETGVKLDNLVHIGHNCRIGENTVIVGCVGVSGSVDIGRNCILAGQSGVIDHIRIGEGSTVMVKTAVTKDVAPGSVVSGLYCRDHREELRIQAAVRRLPETQRQLRRLRKLLEES